jgi:hypothetical protein
MLYESIFTRSLENLISPSIYRTHLGFYALVNRLKRSLIKQSLSFVFAFSSARSKFLTKILLRSTQVFERSITHLSNDNQLGLFAAFGEAEVLPGQDGSTPLF